MQLLLFRVGYLGDLALLQEELAVATLVVCRKHIARLVGRYIGIDEESFAAADDHVRTFKRPLALAKGFHFMSEQLDAGDFLVTDFVAEMGFLVRNKAHN